MKKVLVLATVGLTLTSCYEFRRNQHFKDAENNGKSALIEATSSKQVQIEDARGLAEASELKAKSMINIAKAEAQAEIEKAKGVAEANKIIGESMKGNREYLEYLKIEALKNGKFTKVYIPTEANVPILEAK